MHKPSIAHRIIAGLLLLNHLLASCHNASIEPSKKSNSLVVITDRTHEPREAATPKFYDLVIADQEASLTPHSLATSLATQAVQPKTSQIDGEANQLTAPLRKHQQVDLPVTMHHEQKAPQLIPSQLSHNSVLIIPDNQSTGVTKVREHEQEREKHRRTQQLEPVQQLTGLGQQELRTSILQTWQNPLWQRHFSGRQLTTPHPLLNSHQGQPSSIVGHYQLARVQESFQPLAPILSLQTREGHRINFLQDMGYWWGMVQDNRPGFSRSSVLPVLYSQPSYMEQLGRYIQHTVEELLHAPQEVQRQLVHIFSSNKAFKNGFVYMGREMGLVGGGWFSFICSAIVSVVTSTVIGFCVGGPWLAIAGAVTSITEIMRTYRARQETKKRMESKCEKARQVCQQSIQEVKNEVGLISQDPKAYTKRQAICNKIDSYKKQITLQVTELKDWSKSVVEENWFCSLGYSGTHKWLRLSLGIRIGEASRRKGELAKNVLWDNDLEELAKHLEAREQDSKEIDSYIQQAKDKFRGQALEDLKKDREQAESAINSLKENLTSSITGISANTGLGDAKNGLVAIKTQIDVNVSKYEEWKSMYEKWQKEEPLYAIDAAQEVAQINKYIQDEQNKRAELGTEEQLIGYAEQGDNIVNIQQVAEPHLSKEDLQDILANGVDQGDYWLLYYAFHYQSKFPNTIVDEEENTVLHRAVLANQARIVQLCLQYGAGKLIRNRSDEEHSEGRTPLDLAANNPTIKQLLEASN